MPYLLMYDAPFFFKPTSGDYCGSVNQFSDDFVKYQSAWSDTYNAGLYEIRLTEGAEYIYFYTTGSFDVTLTRREEWQIGAQSADVSTPLEVIPETSTSDETTVNIRFKSVSLFNAMFVELVIVKTDGITPVLPIVMDIQEVT